MSIPLGPFELENPIGRGGMGEIWRGRHSEQRTPVAIKLLTTRHIHNETSRKLFRDEIQAVAGLHHPGVVMVFDHGIVDDEASKLSKGRLETGAAYLVMELASLGSLKKQRGVMPWIHLRSVIVSLLDALAHAHARGVIHRDIKPGNVLLCGPSDVRPGLKLADFGLAHTVERFDEVSEVTGTPRYMAPEQFKSQWRDFGPWTDLYALGMVAWEMICGTPAFTSTDVKKIAAKHLAGELPPLNARVPVPAGLEDWLRRMVNREPRLRFQRAADAAFHLAMLPPPDEDDITQPISHPGIISNPTLTLDDTMLLATNSTRLAEYRPEDEVTTEAPRPLRIHAPPLPASWKRPDPPEAPLQLLGVGLGLFGVRTIPLVDRTLERDCAWDAMADAAALRETRAVVLQGASGNGKTRLVRWVSERAHEVGAAHVLKAVHGPIPGPMDGLGPMVSRFYRCVGLSREEILARLTNELAWEAAEVAGEAAAITEMIEAAPSDAEDVVRLSSPTERYVLIRRAIKRHARTRPVIVWLDDVQWGADALAFARYMMAEPPVGPVTLLLTAQEEALAERETERAELEALLKFEGAIRQRLGPLAPPDRRELVRVLLGLEGGLADQLAARTAGNPLFTVQLVGDWVSRGMLVPGQRGFVLRSGARADLPDDLHQVWSQRLERLLANQHKGARQSLIIAAALGQEINEAEWRAICKGARAHVPANLVELLMENRLAEPTDGGWSFSHGMLRESLQRLATEEGLWGPINLACAEALSRQRGPKPNARLGRHLLAAGEYGRAAAHLRKAAISAMEEDDSRRARALLALNEDTLRRLSPPADDPCWGELWLLRARIHSSLSELDEAVREATRTNSHARRHGWSTLRPQAMAQLADVEKNRGNLTQAERLYREALPLFEALDDRPRIARTLVSICHTRILGGDATRAKEPLERAHTLYDELGNTNGMATCLRFFGDIARIANQWEKARDLFLQSTALHAKAGDRSRASSSLHGVAEMNRLLGNLDEAERGYLEVLDLQEAQGVYGAIPRLNLSLCQIARGNYIEARQSLESLLVVWRKQRKRGFIALCQLALTPAVAGMGDWLAYDRHLGEAIALIAQTGMVDIDIGQCAEKAAELALAAKKTERARLALELALRNWEQLGDETQIQAVGAQLETLGRDG